MSVAGSFITAALRWLSGQSLRHKTDVGSAHTAKTRAIYILRCTFRTKHQILPLRAYLSSLSKRLVKQDAGSHCDVKRFDLSSDRNSDQCITTFTNKSMETTSFVT